MYLCRRNEIVKAVSVEKKVTYLSQKFFIDNILILHFVFLCHYCKKNWYGFNFFPSTRYKEKRVLENDIG